MKPKQSSTADARSAPSNQAEGAGYGRPPAHGKFQPGRSGNPKGRPKKTDQLNDILGKALLGSVAVQVGGKSVQMARLEAMCTQALMRGEPADQKMIEQLLKMVKWEIPTQPQESGGPSGGVMVVPAGTKTSFARWEDLFGPDGKPWPNGPPTKPTPP